MKHPLLLVEDDDAVADVVDLHLQQAGYCLQRETDGLQAMAALDRQPFSLLLLDGMLPGADGLDVCRHARTCQPALPIIMLSARAGEIHRVLGLEVGADDYLAKPFSMAELLARVRALLRRAARVQPEPPSTLRFGPAGLWQLDPLRRVLLQGSSPVPLTLREFDLLHFLLRHPQQVFSRAVLLEQVWGTGFDGFEHTVNSHINRLRQKLEADPQAPRFIQTVWGVGYRFEPLGGVAAGTGAAP
jgi:DNA-binding response OmpR family regulator